MRLVAMLIGIVMLGTGCSITIDSTPTAPSPSASASPTLSENDIEYLENVRNEYPEFNKISDQELIDYAMSGCSVLMESGNLNRLMDLVPPGPNSEAMAYALGTGVGIYCPGNV